MKNFAFLMSLFLFGCESTHTSDNQHTSPSVSPSPLASSPNIQSFQSEIEYSDTMEIIRSAAEAAPRKVEGEYILKIKAIGKQGPFIFLNTELDYRDQRAVTIALHPQVISLFEEKYGRSLEEYFVDKSVKVLGEAQRIKINFMSRSGKPSGKYYYQTHIMVSDIGQLEVLNRPA